MRPPPLLFALAALASGCGPDARADFALLLRSYEQIPQGTVDAKAAAGFGATKALNDLLPTPFPAVPASAIGGIDLLVLRTGTRAETLTDMDVDGKPGTGAAQEKVQAFSIAAGDFLGYAHSYKQGRAGRYLAWQTTDREAWLLVDNPSDPYVTVCVGVSGDPLPKTCQVCSPTACGAPCSPGEPLQCGSPPKDAGDGGT